jgi:hypothetical protein
MEQRLSTSDLRRTLRSTNGSWRFMPLRAATAGDPAAGLLLMGWPDRWPRPNQAARNSETCGEGGPSIQFREDLSLPLPPFQRQG